LLFIPSIGITLASGILAVLAQSGLYSERTQEICIIWIAVLASFSVFWQSLVKQLNFGGRALLHHSTAMALSKVLKLATMGAREQQMVDVENLKKNISQPYSRANSRPSDASLDHADEEVAISDGANGVKYDQDASSASVGVDAKQIYGMPVEQPQFNKGAENHDTLTRQFQQALEGCTSVVPVRITTAFDVLNTRVDVCNKRLIKTGNDQPNIEWEKVYPALYHQLTITIISSRLWPYMAPNAEWAVKQTIKDFQDMDACMLKAIIRRTKVIDEEYNSLATEITPLYSA